MGTELLDIHFRIEKRFGIALPVDEVLSFTTVGDIADAIEKRVSAARRSRCVMLPALLDTRRFVRDFQPALPIRPKTPIISVIPSKRRRAFWAAMWKWYGSPPPSLRLPTALRWVYVALGLTVAYIAIFHGWYGMVTAYFVVVAMVVARRFLPLVPPTGFTTFWDVARRRASVDASLVNDVDAHEVFAALQHELSNALGVETSELQRGTRLKEDLSIG